MAIVEVTAKAPKIDKVGTVGYNFGENLVEAQKIFGDELVHNGFVSHGIVQLQALIRRCLEANQDPVELAKSWKPGIKAVIAKDPVAAAKAAFANMDPEAKKAFLADLKKM